MMPRFGRAAAVAALSLLATTAGAQNGSDVAATRAGSRPALRKLTMESAVSTAITNSRTLKIAVEGIKRQRGVYNEGKALALPTLSTDLAWTHLDEGSSASFSTGSNGEKTTIALAKQDQKTVTVSAALALDIMGLIKTAVQASQFQEIQARLEFNRARNQLVADVQGAYYDLLRAQAFVAVVEQALTNATERQGTAEAYLKAGTGTRFDVLRAQTEVANARQNLITATNRVNLATAALNNALGLDQNTPLSVEAPPAASAPGPGFDAAVTEAYSQRPEVMQAEAGLQAALKGIKLADRSSLPAMGIAWNFQYTPDAGGFSPKTTAWVAVAKVTVPLYDAGVAGARRQQATATAETARSAKLQVLDGIALDVRQAFLGAVEASERLSVTSSALEQAEEQYRLAQVRFQNGVTLTPGASPLLEISDAQTALTQAQTNHVNARYDVASARAKLERAVGRYAYDKSPGPGMPAPRIGGGK